MEHIWKNINGWFDFQTIYTEAVINARDGAKFVEIGCFLGKSTSYMAVEIINSGKKITFDVIDKFDINLFKGHRSEKWIYDLIDKHRKFESDDLFTMFWRNVEPVKQGITKIWAGDSIKVAQDFQDNSLDFVFIDANHEYEAVKLDIETWLPKVKVGGVLAGHDHSPDWPGVEKACMEKFGLWNYGVKNTSWIYKK